MLREILDRLTRVQREVGDLTATVERLATTEGERDAEVAKVRRQQERLAERVSYVEAAAGVVRRDEATP